MSVGSPRELSASVDFWPLNGEDRVFVVLVGDRNTLWGGGLQRRNHRGCVGRVGHQKYLVVIDVVGDQIVDHATVLGAAQRVLRLARTNASQVVCKRRIDELRGARAGDQSLSEMADVEEADGPRVATCSPTVPA